MWRSSVVVMPSSAFLSIIMKAACSASRSSSEVPHTQGAARSVEAAEVAPRQSPAPRAFAAAVFCSLVAARETNRAAVPTTAGRGGGVPDRGVVEVAAMVGCRASKWPRIRIVCVAARAARRAKMALSAAVGSAPSRAVHTAREVEPARSSRSRRV